MTKYGFLIVAAVVVITFQEASALKCWRCSSDSSNAAFCDDPFDSSIITVYQKRFSYVECNFPSPEINPYNSVGQTRAVCKKVKRLISDKVVVSRSCFWENVNAPQDSCDSTNTPSHIKTVYCQTCSTDGCNGEKM